MSFAKGDRVQTPDGEEGTVRYVGKVKGGQGTHLGVELDNPAGNNDGKLKGKKYFKCKKKHGLIKKEGYFTKVGGGDGGGDSGGGKKGKKGKDKKGKKSKKDGKSKPEAPPEPTPPPPVVLSDRSCQTEAPRELLAYVDSEYYCKIVTRLLTEQNEKLHAEKNEMTQQMLDLQKRTEEAEAKAQQATYQEEQAMKMVTPLEEQLEFNKIEIEELTVKLEIAQMENEELNDKLQDQLDAMVAEMASDSAAHAQVLKMNEQLKAQLAQMATVAHELLDTKDKHINSLATEHSYVESLSARLKDLLSVEQVVLGLKTQVAQLQEKNEMLEDADRMCQALREENYKLEGELTDWRSWVLDVEAEREILEELHEDDDKHIEDLVREKKDLEAQFFTMDKENKQQIIEIQDLRKELFELRHKMEHQGAATAKEFEKFNFTPNDYKPTALDGDDDGDHDYDHDYNPTDDAAEDKPAHDGFASKGSDRALEAMWHENTKLQQQLKQFRSMLMTNIDSFIESQGHYVSFNLLKQYLPTASQDVDYRGIKVMALIQKLLYKAKTARDLLERLYADPSSAAMRNPELAMRSHVLCPLILHQENYIRAIQEGLLSIKEDDDESWKALAQHFDTNAFGNVAKVYEELLKAIDSAGDSGDLNFEIETLEKQEAFLKEYVEKRFKEFSPDKQKGEALRCSKSMVMANVSETHYRYQSLSIKLNQFNAKLWDLMHTPGPSSNPRMQALSSAGRMDDGMGGGGGGNDMNPTDDADDEPAPLQGYGSENPTDDLASGVEDDPMLMSDDDLVDDPAQRELEEVFKKLKVGAVEKIFRLRNDVVASVQQILQYCQPVELGFGKEKYSLNLLTDANRTAIKWGQLARCKHLSFKAVQRVTLMLSNIKSEVDTSMTARKRVDILNRIIGEEEEHNEEGLINLLENAYSLICDVRKVIGSTLYTTEKTTDEMPPMDYDTFSRPYWECKAGRFRMIFEEQLETQRKLEKSQNAVVQAKGRLEAVRKEMGKRENELKIAQQQFLKEKEKSVDLSRTQQVNTQLTKENEEKGKTIEANTRTIEEQKEQLQVKSSAIEKYKKAIARIKEKESLMGKQVQSVQSTEQTADAGGNARYGTLLVNTEVEYSSLLEQTVQSLRRKVTELTMTKRLTNCTLNLKPLHFKLLRAQMIEKLQKELEEKNRKKMKRVKKKKAPKEEEEQKGTDGDGDEARPTGPTAPTDEEEEANTGGTGQDDEKTESLDEPQEETKAEEEEESEYEWVTDEEAEADELADVLHGGGPVDDSRQKREELERLRKEEDDAKLMEQRLKSLSSSLNEIVSRPLIVDLTKKTTTNDLAQEVIGRRMRLREVGLRYHEIQNKLMQQQQEKSSRNDEEETKMEMGKALGMIRIPNSSLKNLGYDRKHRVVLPSQSFGRLQSSFMTP